MAVLMKLGNETKKVLKEEVEEHLKAGWKITSSYNEKKNRRSKEGTGNSVKSH